MAIIRTVKQGDFQAGAAVYKQYLVFYNTMLSEEQLMCVI